MDVSKVIICLSSDSEDNATLAPSFNCTACGKRMFSASEIHEHPALLGVGICSACNDFLLNKDKIDGVEEQCLWCGQGGKSVMCGQCDKVFCEACFVRNSGCLHGLARILNNDWSCFVCSPALLSVHVNELKEFRKSVSSEGNDSARCKSAGTSITRDAKNVNQGEGATIAEMITAHEQNLERGNQNKSIRTTSRNKNSREKSKTHKSSRKRAGTVDREHTREVKRQKHLENVQQAEPSIPPKTYIRPQQWAEKRREVRERRARAAAELLESGVTDLPNNAPNHQNSNTQTEPDNHGEGGQLLRREGQLDAEHKLPKESASAQVKPVNASESKGKETEVINSESHANVDRAPECAFDKTPRNNLLAKFTGMSSE